MPLLRFAMLYKALIRFCTMFVNENPSCTSTCFLGGHRTGVFDPYPLRKIRIRHSHYHRFVPRTFDACLVFSSRCSLDMPPSFITLEDFG